MNRNQRVIWSDNSILKDLTLALSDYRSDAVVFPYVSLDDYLYIGSELPFNSRYFDLGTVNNVAASVAIWLWNGSAWIPTKDILDSTDTGGVPLAKSGELTYAQDIDKSGWHCERTSNDIPDLAGTYIFNMYWTRWQWNNDLRSDMSLNYIGYLFSDDDDLLTFYPDLANSSLKDAYETGKTTWREQSFAASEAIVRELRRRNVVITRDQIFDTSILLDANCHKTAEIIYGGLGSAYNEAKAKAAKEYIDALNVKFNRVDKDANGTLDNWEKTNSLGFFTR